MPPSSASAVGGPLSGFPGATGVAVEPNALQGYVTDGVGSSVTVLDTTRDAAAGSIGVGAKPTAVAVVPDQGPRASFWISPDRKRAKANLTFHAGASVDADGEIVDYAWSFGDGGHVRRTDCEPRPPLPQAGRIHRDADRHRRRRLLDQQVYTGQTSPATARPPASYAVPSVVVNTRGPGLKLRAAGRRSIARRV